MRRIAALVLAVLAPGAAAAADDATHGAAPRGGAPSGGAPSLAALVTDTRVAEISGIAASRRHDDLLWVHNDSHAGSTLYALGTDGRVRAEVTVRGQANIDWEDLAGYTLDGEPMLLIADTGDNGGVRNELALIGLVEPELAPGPATASVAPRWVLRFRWPDGPRDCEAVAVDAVAREVLLLSKKRVPAQLFRIPLAAAADPGTVAVAEQIASIANVPQPSAAELARDPGYWRYRGQISALDVAPDGLRMVVLSYRDAYLYARRPGEAWRDALARAPRALGLPSLPQAEAIAFDRSGQAIWVTTERLPAPLLHIDLK
jgi:hypothetical protein